MKSAASIGLAGEYQATKSGRDRFLLTLWTDDPVLAGQADSAGIDRIGLDLETLGKRARQRGLDTWISPHTIDRLPALRECLTQARLFARVNPLHEHSRAEVDLLLAHGVQVLMLPMFRSAEQAAEFVDLVSGRAEVVLLLETREAAEDIGRVVAVAGATEVHIGINDMALSMGMRNRFEVLDCELTERVSCCVRDAGLRFGIGGIGRAGDAGLPIPSDLIYAQYPRLGATAALISRAFLAGTEEAIDLTAEVARGRDLLTRWGSADRAELQQARRDFRAALARCGAW